MKESILIGDIGSTKGQWAWLSKEKQVIFETTGYNPVQHSRTAFDQFRPELTAKCPEPPGAVYYYGAGILPGMFQEQVAQDLQQIFPQAQITCKSDLIGAALAVSADKAGIVGIIGTGSNSCLFGGKKIIRQIPSLGFPLGDEGSGADLGRACVQAFYYGLMPPGVNETFAEVLPSDRGDFLIQYRQHPAQNQFLASLAPLIDHHKSSEFVSQMLQERFRSFVRLHILPYGTSVPVHLIGGIAYTFRDILRLVLKEAGLTAGTIVRSPLPGLLTFHHSIQHG